MTSHAERPLALPATTLGLRGPRGLAAELLLIAAAVALPVLAHAGGLPVRSLLPMHWPVILAGLVFGWRGGALTGALAPAASFGLTGAPVIAVLPAMTLELAVYGAVAGWAREGWRMPAVWSVLAAVVAGRIVFVLTVLVTGGPEGATGAYFAAALLPGVPAAVGQVALLPLVARFWVRRGVEEDGPAVDG